MPTRGLSVKMLVRFTQTITLVLAINGNYTLINVYLTLNEDGNVKAFLMVLNIFSSYC